MYLIITSACVCARRGFLKGKTDGAKINLIAGNFTKKLPKTRCGGTCVRV